LPTSSARWISASAAPGAPASSAGRGLRGESVVLRLSAAPAAPSGSPPVSGKFSKNEAPPSGAARAHRRHAPAARTLLQSLFSGCRAYLSTSALQAQDSHRRARLSREHMQPARAWQRLSTPRAHMSRQNRPQAPRAAAAGARTLVGEGRVAVAGGVRRGAAARSVGPRRQRLQRRRVRVGRRRAVGRRQRVLEAQVRQQLPVRRRGRTRRQARRHFGSARPRSLPRPITVTSLSACSTLYTHRRRASRARGAPAWQQAHQASDRPCNPRRSTNQANLRVPALACHLIPRLALAAGAGG